MVLQEIKKIFSRREHTHDITIGSSLPTKVSEFAFLYGSFRQPEFNLAEAKREGCQPVNYQVLRQRFPLTELANAVLFDTPPMGLIPGNHWRVVEIDDETKSMDIQLCGTLGNYNIPNFPPFTVSQKDALFTGLNVIQYEKDGKPVSLDTAHTLVSEGGYGAKKFTYPADLKLASQTIYFANQEGTLLTKGPLNHKKQ